MGTFLELDCATVTTSSVQKFFVEQSHGFGRHLLVHQLLDPSLVVEKSVVAAAELSVLSKEESVREGNRYLSGGRDNTEVAFIFPAHPSWVWI